MSTVTSNIGYHNVGGFPAGSAVDHILVTLTGTNPANNQSQSVAPGTASVVFTSVAPDTYELKAQAKDAANADLGGSTQTNVTVTSGSTVTLSIPFGITASVS